MDENFNSEKMSENDLMDVMKFAQEIYSSGMFGYYTPFMSNQNLVSLNNNPLIPTKDSLEQALKGYKESSDALQAYNEFAEVYDRLFSKTLDYYSNLLSFNYLPICKNAYSPNSDYKSKDYKEDKRRVAKFFDNFDHKDEFARILKQMLRMETVYTWFRDSKGTFDETGEIVLYDNGQVKTSKASSYTLQMMPQNYCMLTGRWEGGLLYDFNMNYFLRAGVDIRSYDPVFLNTYWKNTFNSDGKPVYNPTAPLSQHDGTFAMWTQTSPEDGAWVWKRDMSNMSATPILSSFIRNILNNVDVQSLQVDINMLTAKAILAGEIPLIDKQISGNTQDATAYKLSTFTKFMKSVKMGLDKNINAVGLPTINGKFYQYENKNPDMYSKQLETSSGLGASAGRLIYSSGKMSQSEMENAIYTDYLMMKRLYPQFEHFLNFYVNKKTKKYKFKFILSGSPYPFIQELEKDNLMELANVGQVLSPHAYAKIVDMSPFDYERCLEEGKYSEWTDKLLSRLLSIHTQSGEESKGRPRKRTLSGDSRDYDNSN